MQASSRLKIFLLAGVKTSPSAFYSLQERLFHKFNNQGITPDIEMLFPYGESERNLLIQLMEVRADLSRYLWREGVGVKKVWNRITPYQKDPKLLLIGHSGGGVAAYRIARKLHQDAIPIQTKVIQIGSPKTKIVPELKDRVSYIHAVDEYGKFKDPITKLGSWGGWSMKQETLPVPYWNSTKFAPGTIISVDTLGGHADYFRQSEKFTDQQKRCNLDKTMQRIDGCLNEWL